MGHFAKECRRSCDHKCGKCGKIGQFELCCKTKQNKECTPNRSTSQFRENTRGKPKNVRRGAKGQGQHVALQVAEETMDGNQDGNHANSDDFYVFTAGNIEGQNTVEMLIEDKPANVIIYSGANCNLMSEEVFEFVTGGNTSLLECSRKVYAYASSEPLQLIGKCNLTVQVLETHKSFSVEFLITRNRAATLLGRDTSEVLGVL